MARDERLLPTTFVVGDCVHFGREPRNGAQARLQTRPDTPELTYKSITANLQLMPKSTSVLAETLSELTARARTRGLTDSEWAARARLRKETLSRLRRRHTCDLETLTSLAQVVGARLGVLGWQSAQAAPDGHFPAQVPREYEEQLVSLCASNRPEAQRWAALGPRFFMAGLAVMVASLAGRDRRTLLALAEELHPGASEPAVFARWLERTPVKPSRFLPMVQAEVERAS